MVPSVPFLRTSLGLLLFLWAADGAASVQLPSIPGAVAPIPIAIPMPVGRPVPITLWEAVLLGVRNNRGLRIAGIERIAQRLDLGVAEAKFDPRYNLAGGVLAGRSSGIGSLDTNVTPLVGLQTTSGAQIGFSWAMDRGVYGTQRSTSATANLFVSQPLLRGVGETVNTASIRSAHLDDLAHQIALKGTTITTVSNIVFGYRQMIAAREALVLAKTAQSRADDLITNDRALIVSGRLAALDIVQTEVSAANQRLAVLFAEHTLDTARLSLLGMLALDLRTNLVAADTLVAEHIPVSLEHVLPVALANRPDILGAKLPIEQARLTLLLAKDNRRWDLSVVGIASLAQQNNIGNDSIVGRAPPAVSAGLQLNIPLNNPALRAAEGQAVSAVTVAELQLEDLRASAELQVRDAVQGLETDWKAALLSRQARDLAAKQLSVARDRLQFGRASTFEVVSVENDLRQADNAQLTASIAYLNAATTLDQQLGTTLDTWLIGFDAS